MQTLPYGYTHWLIILLLFLPARINALEERGTELLNTCMSERQALTGNPTASVRYGLCLGYLKGVADSLNGKAFCLPETGETARITQRLKQTYIVYALEQREALNRAALQSVIPAFKSAFPCN